MHIFVSFLLFSASCHCSYFLAISLENLPKHTRHSDSSHVKKGPPQFFLMLWYMLRLILSTS